MVESGNTSLASAVGAVRVWDMGVRLFHWLFAAAVIAELILGYLAPPNLLNFHVWIGYAVIALVVFRLIWGFSGSTFARFSAFPPSPAAALGHISGRHKAGLGHNPLGALMVYGLLAIAAVIVLTGLATLGAIERQGMFAPLFQVAEGRTLRELHGWAAILIIGMIAAHIAGVIFESIREKQNLVRAMVTGDKLAMSDPTPVRNIQPLRAFGLTAAAFAALAGLTFTMAKLPQPRIPHDAPLTAWVDECSACHTPHHPSLLPAQTWKTIMASLDDHFGEDASLDAKTTEAITVWLVANSAENFDTKAAGWFREPDAANPLRITATARWKRIHDHIAADTFKRAKVGSPANCGACHGDAVSGRFARQSILIPPA